MKNYFIKTFFVLGISILASTYGCKKDAPESGISPNTYEFSKLPMLNLPGASGPSLDWENISFMPTPPNTPLIPVPWQGGLGGAKIDDDIIFDYKHENGWELVYNTFSTTASYNPQYFMLYNKYRGLLRVYFYITLNSNYPSSNITHFLNLRGAYASGSPILNFAAQDIIDISTNSQSIGELQPYKVSSTGSWYAAEFEMAYDANTVAKPYDQLRLDWSINPNSIANVSLNGTQTGELSGTITTTSSGSNIFSTAANSIATAGAKVASARLDKLSFIKDNKILMAVADAATNGLAGVVKGFVSGILGGTSKTSTEKVNLNISTKIALTGTATTESQIFDDIFSIPGTQNVINTVPFYPSYSDPVGVFYISAKPIVVRTVQSTKTTYDGSVGYDVDQRYSIDENSFQLVFNPAVTNIADIQNITKEVVMLDVVPSNISGLIQIGGTEEQVAEKTYYTGPVTGIERFAPRPLTVSTGLAVRISFDVVPKDGSARCRIVKTFLATQG